MLETRHSLVLSLPINNISIKLYHDDDDERSSISVDLPWPEAVIDC